MAPPKYNPFAGFTENEDEAIATGIGARKVVAGDIPPITEIPIIDLSAAFSDDIKERKKVAKEIFVACSQIGFFYIKNHGVDLNLIEQCQKYGLGFFQDLTHEQKMELSMAHNKTEYYGYAPKAIQMPDGAIKRRGLRSQSPHARQLLTVYRHVRDHPLGLRSRTGSRGDRAVGL